MSDLEYSEMRKGRRIYRLDGLSEEAIAVCFAKCSRSSKSFEEIGQELTEEGSRRFHEKWVVGYGHSSVAEHAVVQLAMENVSLLAGEWIEDNRLASYTEKSSRYQVYDRRCYLVPEELKRDKHYLKIYREVIESLLDVYGEMREPMKAWALKKYPGQEGVWVDQIRFLLPMAMYANLGMTANVRVWEYAISKWLSSPFLEVRKIGEEVKKEVEKVCPSLVKYASKNEYLKNLFEFEGGRGRKDEGGGVRKGGQKVVELVSWERGGLDRVLASFLYRNSVNSYSEILRQVKSKSLEWKKKILRGILSKKTEHDRLPRDFEHIYLSFDVLCDEGAYYDLKRNRMMTQVRQGLGVENGYMMPRAVKEIGFEKKYREVMGKTEKGYWKLKKKYPFLADYLVTKAHNRRFLMKMNLRELFYFVRLRGRKTGNFSYRRVAMACLEEARRVYPEIMEFFEEGKDLVGRREIEKEYFARFV